MLLRNVRFRSLKLYLQKFCLFGIFSKKLHNMDLNRSEKCKVIVIIGATGSGKTKLAVELCKLFNGEAISTDSMQVYKGLDIASNKVTNEEADGIPHHMISYLPPLTMGYTVVSFRNRALEIIADIHKRKKVPVIVGGTNYYMEALLWKILVDSGKHEEHLTFDNVMKNLPENFLKLSNEDLHAELAKVDPIEAGRILPSSRRRVQRCLQYFFTTQKPISASLEEQRGEKGGNEIGGPLRFENSCMLWLKCETNVLNKRLDKRVDTMLQNGLLEELDQFYSKYQLQYEKLLNVFTNQYSDSFDKGIFRCIGLKEFKNYLALPKHERLPDGTETDQAKKEFAQALHDLRIATRRYAKRQVKWVMNRCLADDRDAPPIYSLNGTYANLWDQNVSEPAIKIVDAFLNNESIDLVPMPKRPAAVRGDLKLKNHCSLCDKSMIGYAMRDHLRSKTHLHSLREQKRIAQDIAEILNRLIDETVRLVQR